MMLAAKPSFHCASVRNHSHGATAAAIGQTKPKVMMPRCLTSSGRPDVAVRYKVRQAAKGKQQVWVLMGFGEVAWPSD